MVQNQHQGQGDGKPCICLECGTTIPYRNWVTCLESNCPMCGAVMVREGSPYHRHVMKWGFAEDERAFSARRGARKRTRKGPTTARPGAGHQVPGEFSFS